jgi:hypothetical protein
VDRMMLRKIKKRGGEMGNVEIKIGKGGDVERN